ncbi:MAG: CoB--CoM heterodisulfide reductase iron-sulfur subunit B family protein [Deltaproteobacteria bacterium]|nr:CoB--CoM heterodisulfide reductase iron-sulfur subunit B family protein [Deltaproteobacteria bacterium]MBW2073778.1 CoB--CoM heterodisulfide reductase iron-sulfur subunit B family protein [Deltaproteobacteria bacterium]
MKIALFPCCSPPVLLVQYESSSRAVLGRVGVAFMDIREFNCCGYPLRNFNFRAFVLSSARNLALAEKQKANLMTVCNCCYGNLKYVDYLMKEDLSLANEVNTTLKKEGLIYEGRIRVMHLLDVLYNQVGIEHIKERIEKTFEGLKIATHYGCHILRPSKIVEFDNPLAPSIFDQLVEVTGAESVHWRSKLECCGAPLFGINDDLSMDLTERKIKDGKESGADYLCTACPFCHIQFDTVQKMIPWRRGANHYLPSILYPQLLGLSMGIDEKTLGLDMNELDISGVKKFLSKP